jgi:hypothetical protein
MYHLFHNVKKSEFSHAAYEMCFVRFWKRSRDSSVGIAKGYVLDSQQVQDFSLLHSVQTDPWVSQPIRWVPGSFLRCKEREAWSSPLMSRSKLVQLYLHSSTSSGQRVKIVNVKVKAMLRPEVCRPVCLYVKPPPGAPRPNFFTARQLLVCWCGVPSDESTGLSFTIAAGPRQCSHSRVRVPRDSWPYSVSVSRLPQPGGPGPRIYNPPRNSGTKLYPQTLGSHFVASYDWQGYGGGVLTRLLTATSQNLSQSYITGSIPPINLSWRQVPWDPRPEFLPTNWTLAVIVLI